MNDKQHAVAGALINMRIRAETYQRNVTARTHYTFVDFQYLRTTNMPLKRLRTFQSPFSYYHTFRHLEGDGTYSNAKH